jgi:hypothetical protein
MQMRLNKLLVPLAFSMLFGSGVVVSSELSDFSSEPSDCYEAAFDVLALGAGADGVAVKLCSGTTDASKTIECFMKAHGRKENGGLGLTKGWAMNLCKSNSEPF